MGIERPWVFLLLPIVVTLHLLWRQRSFFGFPSMDLAPKDWGGRAASFFTRTVPMILMILLLFMAAGVRMPEKTKVKYGYGADIVFILDESASMQEPLAASGSKPGTAAAPSKFDTAKMDIMNFTEKRRDARDRYGLTVFGSSAVRVLPLTFNHALFLKCLNAQNCILTSTVISQALAVGLDELTHSRARSRALIFVSDGGGSLEDDKYGFSRIIRKEGIRFYWIAVGAGAFNELPQFLGRIGPLGKRIDAANASQLEAAFTEIYKMEPSVIVYRSSSRAFSPDIIVYTAFILMVLIWIVDSLHVYNRKA